MSQEHLVAKEASVFSTLRSHYESLSDSERKVVDYLLANANRLSFLSISDLALAAGASESTIVRLVRKLDFTGFAEFKKALFADMIAAQSHHEVSANESFSENDDIKSVGRKYFSLMRTALIDTMAMLEEAAYERAVVMLAKARRIEIYANNLSGHIVQASIYRFLTLGLDAHARVEQIMQPHYATHLTPDDVVIILSHSGAASNLVDILTKASERGAEVIAITSNHRSAVAQRASTHLLTVLPNASVGHEAGVIRIAQIALLEALAMAAAHHKRQQGERDT